MDRFVSELETEAECVHDDEGVSTARAFVAEMVDGHSRGSGANVRTAMQSVARACRVTTTSVRKFYQPSREPKGISVGLFRRFWSGYSRWLRGELDKLRNRLHLHEQEDGVDPRLHRELATEAKALIERLRLALEKRRRERK